MAKRWHATEDIQVDPFNAGEPTLPWNEPEALHDSACNLESPSYKGPTKTRDNYDAPSEKARTNKTRFKTTRVKKTKSEDSSAKHQDLRSIIKRIVIFIIAINVISAVVGAIVNITEVIFSDSAVERFFEDDKPAIDMSEDGLDFDRLNRDESTAAKLVQDSLEAVTAPDSPYKTTLATGLSTLLEDDLHLSAEDLGLDANAYAEWWLSHFTYQLSSSYVNNDGEANVYFDTWAPRTYAVSSTFADEAEDYLENRGVYAQGDEQPRNLLEEEQNEMRAIFARVLEEAQTDENCFLCATLEWNNEGSFVLDADEMNEELMWSFGIG